MSRLHCYRVVLAVIGMLTLLPAWADPAPFDLLGPMLVGSVKRGESTLPITMVPNFVAGDQLSLRAELPENQSAHYLMVVAFLRGPTNPPPDEWFYECKTWKKNCIKSGLSLTVPKDAQQVLVFFAPETGGDFKTLRSAVQGRPGAFVRAAQELNQAALDRSRLDHYLASVRELEDTEPAKLKETAPLLARTLAIKVDEKCLDRIPALQAPCLMQNHESMILNDGHETSMVTALTSGPASDLAMQAGSTAKMESGAYLPYIGSVFDIARLLDSFHTAHYQYIPALATPRDDRLVLMLNTPPSFHEPQSVLVAALPAVDVTRQPTLHAVDSSQAYCAYRTPLALAVEGAPLVFSTRYAHDLALNIATLDGKGVALPVRADAMEGGLAIDTSALATVDIDENNPAVLSGYWGFEKFSGPGFKLFRPQQHPWALAPGDDVASVVGREDIIHIQSGNANCLEDIRMQTADGQETTLAWKIIKPDAVELKLPLQTMQPGAFALELAQYGAPDQRIQLSAYADAGHIDSFTMYAGDTLGILKGSRLDQVESLQFKGNEFATATLSSADGGDVLTMVASDAKAVASLKAGESAKAKIKLKDGRSSSVTVTIAAPRPRALLIGKSIKLATPTDASTIELVSADELPLDATLAFSIKIQWPQAFSRNEQIEVTTTNQSGSVILSMVSGALTLESANVAVATLQPAAAFGHSAFGELQFRMISRGIAGDWQRLATLVRLPTISKLQCSATADSGCMLWGSNLFLLDSVASDAQFTSPVQVPEGFSGFSLTVPQPVDGRLYIRLRDNPGVTNIAAFSLPPSTASSVIESAPDSKQDKAIDAQGTTDAPADKK